MRQSQRPCASRRKRTRQDNGGNHPSCSAQSQHHDLSEVDIAILVGVHHRDEHLHLVVEDLALASLSLRDQAVVEHIEHILAHFLEFELDLLTVLADDTDVLV